MPLSRRRFLGGLGAGALAAVAGCSDPGSRRPDALAWTYHPIGETNDLVVTDDRVYVPGETLYALRPDKTEEWSYEPPDPATRLLVGEDLVLQLSPDSWLADRVHTVSRDGTPGWTMATRGDRFASVAGLDATSVYVSTFAEADTQTGYGEYALLALDAATGAERWRRDGLDADYLRTAGETLYVVSSRTVLALDRADGSARWTRQLPPGDIDLAPLAGVDGRHLYVEDTDGDGLLALDRADGSTQWSYGGLFEVVDARVGADRVYALALRSYRPDEVVALDPATGGVQWGTSPSQSDEGLQLGPLRSGTLYVGGSTVSAVDTGSGRLRWRWTPDDDEAWTVDFALDGTAFATRGGRLLCVADGERRWSYLGNDNFFPGGVASHGAYFWGEDTVYRFRP